MRPLASTRKKPALSPSSASAKVVASVDLRSITLLMSTARRTWGVRKLHAPARAIVHEAGRLIAHDAHEGKARRGFFQHGADPIYPALRPRPFLMEARFEIFVVGHEVGDACNPFRSKEEHRRCRIELRVLVKIELQVMGIASKRIVSIAGFAH